MKSNRMQMVLRPNVKLGARFVTFDPEIVSTAITMKFRIKFSEDFDFGTGGILPGIWGGNIGETEYFCRPEFGFEHSMCFHANVGWTSDGYFTVVNRFGYKGVNQDFPDLSIEPDIINRIKITPGVEHNLEMFVKLNKPGKLDGCVTLKHINYGPTQGTAKKVNNCQI